MTLIRNAGADHSSSRFRIILCLTFMASIFMCGCRAAPTWSAEARSPDGERIATASTFANGGFVAPGPSATFAYLNWVKGSQPKTLILALSGGRADANSRVEMNWLTPTHLGLTYKGERSIDFQATRCDGVDISLRQLPG